MSLLVFHYIKYTFCLFHPPHHLRINNGGVFSPYVLVSLHAAGTAMFSVLIYCIVLTFIRCPLLLMAQYFHRKLLRREVAFSKQCQSWIQMLPSHSFLLDACGYRSSNIDLQPMWVMDAGTIKVKMFHYAFIYFCMFFWRRVKTRHDMKSLNVVVRKMLNESIQWCLPQHKAHIFEETFSVERINQSTEN